MKTQGQAGQCHTCSNVSSTFRPHLTANARQLSGVRRCLLHCLLAEHGDRRRGVQVGWVRLRESAVDLGVRERDLARVDTLDPPLRSTAALPAQTGRWQQDPREEEPRKKAAKGTRRHPMGTGDSLASLGRSTLPHLPVPRQLGPRGCVEGGKEERQKGRKAGAKEG